MKTSLKYFVISLFIIISFGCSKPNKIKDIIPPIKITSGTEDSVVVSDLFYADNYSIKFNANPNLETKYDELSQKIYLKADSNFEGITLLEFEADMNVYEIPVISKKQKLYTFSFKPDKKYEKLNLFGSFNGWDRSNLTMTD
ncbi:MAG: hypothetical protein KDC52_09625, partial [Ignavibacteriae bacterium]|nr:hypothetical protein [Ignavibacteriota bacterium]